MKRRVLILACLLAVTAVARAQLRAVEPAQASSLEQLPFDVDGWRGRTGPSFDASVLEVLRADDHINRIYAQEQQVAGVFVAYFRSQRFGATVHSPLNCLPGSGWQPLEATMLSLNERGTAKRVVIQKGDDRQVVVYWYETLRRAEGSEYWSKIHLVTDAFRSRRNDIAFVRVIAPVRRGTPNAMESATETALTLARALQPRVAGLLFK